MRCGVRNAGLLAALVLSSACQATLVASGANQITHPLRIPSPDVIDGARVVEFRTADGLTLRGWRFEPVGPPRGLLVLVHGRDINRAMWVGHIQPLVNRGYVVVAYDQRAHGASDGELCTFGAREVPDLQAVIAQSGVAAPVVLIGMSLGAAVSLQLTAIDPSIAAVAAVSSYAQLKPVLHDHKPFFMSDETFELAVASAEQTAGFSVAHAAPVEGIGHITVPLLLIHGSADPFTNVMHAYQLKKAAPPQARLVVLEGAEHVNIVTFDQTWAAVHAFLDALPTGNAVR